MIFPLSGPHQRGIVSVEAKKKQVGARGVLAYMSHGVLCEEGVLWGEACRGRFVDRVCFAGRVCFVGRPVLGGL